MKFLKKITVFIAVLAMLGSLVAVACPHYDHFNMMYFINHDEEGNRWQFTYPLDYAFRELHFKYNEDGTTGDKILEYFHLYLYPPEKSVFGDWEIIDSTTDYVLIDYKKDQTIYPIFYKLKVPVKKIYQTENANRDPKVYRIAYILKTVEINKNLNSSKHTKIANALKSRDYIDIGADMLQMSAYIDRMILRPADIDTLPPLSSYPDPIQITFEIQNAKITDPSRLCAVSVNESNLSVTELGGIYNQSSKTFTFSTSKPGIYAVVQKPKTANVPSSVSTSSSESSAASSQDGGQSSGEQSSGRQSSLVISLPDTMSSAPPVDTTPIAVIDAIDALPNEITLENAPAVIAIRESYDALSQEQKDQVTNYEKLQKAEEVIASLLEAAASSEDVSDASHQQAVGEQSESDVSSERQISSGTKSNNKRYNPVLAIVVIGAMILIGGSAAVLYFVKYGKDKI